MKIPNWICVLSIWCFLLPTVTLRRCQRPKPVLELLGDVALHGYFGIHTGINCSTADPVGLQQMAAAAWVVNTLNQNNYIPGIKIGISLYDSCGAINIAQKLLTLIANERCTTPYNIGLLTTPSIYETLPNESANASVFVTDRESPNILLVDTTINLLTTLNWTTIDYMLAPSYDLLSLFNNVSSHNRICVKNHLKLPDFQNLHWKHILYRRVRLEGNNALVILFGTWEEIIPVHRTLNERNITNIQWILVPFDTITKYSGTDNIAVDSLIVLPGIGILQERSPPEVNITSDSDEEHNTTEIAEKRIFINYSLFINVAVPILKIARKLKGSVAQYCGTRSDARVGICPALPPFYSLQETSTPDNYPEIKEIIKMILFSDYSIVTAVTRMKENNYLEDLALYEEGPEGNNAVLRIVEEIDNSVHSGEYCSSDQNNTPWFERECAFCSNFYRIRKVRVDISEVYGTFVLPIGWRGEAWVAAVTSIASVGVLCALVIAVFIAVRVCKGDVLEGNPAFSFLLLFSIVFTYLSTLPFSLTYDEDNEHMSSFFCALRITGTSTSYSLMFSIMLSRSLMLVSFDHDGTFLSHINGFLQSILCMFILAVQIALSVQFLLIRTAFFSTEKCMSMYEGYNFQILLCYNVFLLLLLVCTSPFAIRSKRNYNEGMFFTVAAFICLLVWVSWTTAYLLIPREWKDVATSAGLTATASGILVTVFIPRTYLMMTAIIRDNIASALPSLACTNSTSILDLNYRTTSNQVLYDCVNPFPGGQLNPNFYSEQPQSVGIFKPDEVETVTADTTYEMYDSPSSPNKVTHF